MDELNAQAAPDALHRLAGALLPDPGGASPVYLRQGKITGVSAPLVSLTLGGSTTVVSGIAKLASYTATVNDVVWVLQSGTMLLVLGKQG